jgi:hypothetical protein
MKIILPTYRTIGWIVKAYAHLHNIYWGAPVVLLAEDDYSEGQFEFVRPPLEELISWSEPGDIPGEIPNRHFTDILIWYLRQIEDRHVIIMLADYLLTEPVNVQLIKQLQEYMELNDRILRGHIGYSSAFYQGQCVDRYKDLDIWEGKIFPASLCPAMWSRELLLEMMLPSNTAWDFEINGRNKFPWNGCRSVAAQPIIVHYINSLRSRSMSSMVITREVYDEVKQYLRINVQQFID